MKLHEIKHDLPTILWCGPAALSATTGRSTSEIHAAIQEIRQSQKPVKGVAHSTLALAAKRLGYRLEVVYDYWADTSLTPRKKPTLAAFLRNFRPYLQDHPVIVNVTGHYVVVFRRSFVDNQVKKPVSLRQAPGRRRRVKRAWKVIPYAICNQPQCC